MWVAGAPELEPIPQQPVDGEVDVAIVGAGYTGLSAARTLAREGHKVAVFDRHNAGWGASSRNGGMVTIGSKRTLHSWIEGYGRDKAVQLWQASRDAVELVEQLVRDEGIDCCYERCGFLNVAWKPEHFGRLAEKQRLLWEVVGHDTHLIAPRDLGDELAAQGFHGGLVDDLAGGLDPARYVRGLSRIARAAGAVIYEHTTVLSKHREGDGQRIVTDQGELKASAVLIATNGYTRTFTPRLRRAVIPVGSQIIATEPLGEERARELIPKGRMIFDTKNLLYYFRRTPDHRLLFGGRASFAERDPHQTGRILRRHLMTLFPQLADVDIEYTWQGLVGYTLDLDPHVGRLGPDHFALGYCGHGVALGTYLGRAIARFMMNEGECDPFVNLRPPNAIPLYYGWPWFMPLGAAYYRLRDRIG